MHPQRCDLQMPCTSALHGHPWAAMERRFFSSRSHKNTGLMRPHGQEDPLWSGILTSPCYPGPIYPKGRCFTSVSASSSKDYDLCERCYETPVAKLCNKGHPLKCFGCSKVRGHRTCPLHGGSLCKVTVSMQISQVHVSVLEPHVNICRRE